MDRPGTRVLHVAQPITAGVPAVVRTLVADQMANGLDVHIACPRGGDLGPAPHHRWEATRDPGPSVPGETRRLARIVRDLRPDVVHLHSSKAGLAGRLAIRGRVATVFSPHAWSFLAVTGARRTAALAWERLAARWTDAFVAVSEDELREGRARGVRGEAFVVPNAVDLARHAPGPPPPEARAALGLDAAPLAVCVGRLSEQKGQDLLVADWRAEHGRLALVGDGPLAEDVRAAARDRAGKILFAGDVDDPRPWYAAADVVVVPSRWEGMALVPLEAMAAGRAVVAFDVGGVRESVPPEAGAIVAAGDAAALVREVAQRLRDPARAAREGEHGRRHVEAHHDAAATAARVREVYETVSSRRRRSASGRR